MYDILIGLRGRYHQVGDLRKDNNNPTFSLYSVFVMFFHTLFSTKRKINKRKNFLLCVFCQTGNIYFEFDITNIAI